MSLKNNRLTQMSEVSTPQLIQVIMLAPKSQTRAGRKKRVMRMMILGLSSKSLSNKQSQLVSKFQRKIAVLSRSKMDILMKCSKRSRLI